MNNDNDEVCIGTIIAGSIFGCLLLIKVVALGIIISSDDATKAFSENVTLSQPSEYE